MNWAASRLDPGLDLTAACLVAAAERDAAAFGGKLLHRCAADARGAAGDHHDLAVEAAAAARFLLRQVRGLAERHATGEAADHAGDGAERGAAQYRAASDGGSCGNVRSGRHDGLPVAATRGALNLNTVKMTNA